MIADEEIADLLRVPGAKPAISSNAVRVGSVHRDALGSVEELAASVRTLASVYADMETFAVPYLEVGRMSILTSNVMKVGAHLDDTRAFVEAWDPALDANANVERIVDENLLGLPSRSRAHDVMTRALRPRFIVPDAGILDALAVLAPNADAFRDACYFELTRIDALIATFVREQLAEWWDEGTTTMDTSDVRRWIDKVAADGRVPDWSPNIRDRVARGLLATLRDLGRLTGARSSPRKEIAGRASPTAASPTQPSGSTRKASPAAAILTSPVWRRWLLDERRVDEMMHRIAGLGIVYYSVAGSTRRIDWRLDTLAEVVRAAA